MLLAGIGSTLLLVLIAVLTQNSWVTDMLLVIINGQQSSSMEWNKFTTLAGLFSLPPWIGFGMWLLFLPILVLIDNQFRSVPSIIWLPITLVLSLATAPYAFAYDLPIILPALVWLSLPLSPLSTIVIFTVTCVVIFAGFSSIAYIAVFIIAIFSLREAILQAHLKVDN